jgi:hypothetical protein
MNTNTVFWMSILWVIGTAVGISLGFNIGESPSITAVLGFVILGALSGMLFFGRTAEIFILGIGFVQAGLTRAFPIPSLLLGLCVIASVIYGKTLGEWALEDFLSQGKTRLPQMALAAFLNLLLILGFAILVWFLWELFPRASDIGLYLPIGGLGV